VWAKARVGSTPTFGTKSILVNTLQFDSSMLW
jgi:hypothetical protein